MKSLYEKSRGSEILNHIPLKELTEIARQFQVSEDRFARLILRQQHRILRRHKAWQ